MSGFAILKFAASSKLYCSGLKNNLCIYIYIATASYT